MPSVDTSPAVVSAADVTTVTTASFTRPAAGGLLVAEVMCTSNGATALSGGSLTWTRRSSIVSETVARAEVWTAPVTGSGTMTVTLTVTGTDQSLGLKVLAVSGQHPSSPIGQTGNGTSTTNAVTINGYTSSAAGSRGFCAAFDLIGGGVPTSTDTGFGWYVAGGYYASGIGIHKASDTPSSGTVVTFNLDASGSDAANWKWAALEILPASTGASVDITTVDVVTTVPAPDVSAGASSTPAAVDVVTTVPAPSVSAGASTVPAAVAVVTTVPVPAVTVDTAEVVTPTTVAVPLTIPTPDVSTSSAIQPGTVSVATAVYTPDVDAEFNADVTLTTVAVGVTVDGAVATVPVLPGDQLDGLASQIEWNGFIIGRGTPYRWQDLEGWRGKDSPDSGNAPRANRRGSAPGRPLSRERTLRMIGLITARRDEVEAVVLALENATPHERDARQSPIVINDLGTPYLAYGRIDQVYIPGDLLLRMGVGKIVLQWILAEPRRYNVNATGVTVPINSIVEITNAGNSETNPLIIFPGLTVGPRLHNLTLDRVTEWNLTVPSGQELIVDTDLGTAKLHDATSGAELADVGNDMSFGSVSIWDWILDRGPQDVEYTAASGGSQAEVLYRDAWD